MEVLVKIDGGSGYDGWEFWFRILLRSLDVLVKTNGGSCLRLMAVLI